MPTLGISFRWRIAAFVLLLQQPVSLSFAARSFVWVKSAAEASEFDKWRLKTAAGSKHRSVGPGRVSIKCKDTNLCEYLNLKPALDEFSDGSSSNWFKKKATWLFSFLFHCSFFVTLLLHWNKERVSLKWPSWHKIGVIGHLSCFRHVFDSSKFPRSAVFTAEARVKENWPHVTWSPPPRRPICTVFDKRVFSLQNR